MTISMHLTAVLITIVGLVAYLLPLPPKVVEVARISFMVGLWGIIWLIVHWRRGPIRGSSRMSWCAESNSPPSVEHPRRPSAAPSAFAHSPPAAA